MRMIVLAAGSGTRLRPYTDDRPKCMVPLHGYPLLAWLLASARQAGVDDIAVVGGYKVERMEAPGTRLRINADFAATNMVYTLWTAREEMVDDVIISYADIVYEPKVLTALMEVEAEVSVVVDRKWRSLWERRFADPLSDAESLDVGADGRIATIGQKVDDLDAIKGQYIGLMRYRGAGLAAVLAAIDKARAGSPPGPRPFEKMYMTDLLQGLVNSGVEVRPVWIDGGWLEVDSTDDLALATTIMKPKGGPDDGFSVEL